MNITDKNIDGGRPFDWGRMSARYAKYRDIYPPEFYEKIIAREKSEVTRYAAMAELTLKSTGGVI